MLLFFLLTSLSFSASACGPHSAPLYSIFLYIIPSARSGNIRTSLPGHSTSAFVSFFLALFLCCCFCTILSLLRASALARAPPLAVSRLALSSAPRTMSSVVNKHVMGDVERQGASDKLSFPAAERCGDERRGRENVGEQRDRDGVLRRATGAATYVCTVCTERSPGEQQVERERALCLVLCLCAFSVSRDLRTEYPLVRCFSATAAASPFVC